LIEIADSDFFEGFLYD
jgi:hypothetical protein